MPRVLLPHTDVVAGLAGMSLSSTSSGGGPALPRPVVSPPSLPAPTDSCHLQRWYTPISATTTTTPAASAGTSTSLDVWVGVVVVPVVLTFIVVVVVVIMVVV